MKKLTCLLVITFLLFLTARSQDLGYKTIDVGGEFLGSPKGYTVALHLAYNLQVHHGFQFRIAYNRSNWKDKGKHDMEEGSGAGQELW